VVVLLFSVQFGVHIAAANLIEELFGWRGVVPDVMKPLERAEVGVGCVYDFLVHNPEVFSHLLEFCESVLISIPTDAPGYPEDF
jgi:hypothetical protein